MAQTAFDVPPRDLVSPAASSGTGSWGTSRFSAANSAELYYSSLQYEGLASWESDLPLKQRKPREVIPLFKMAVETIHSFIWGGSRFPRIAVAATRTSDDAADSDEIGPRLWDGDARDLTTFVQELVRAARLDRAVAEFSRKALITTSAAVLLSVRNGRVCYYVEDGKHCTPTWSEDDPRKIKSIEICYQFERQEQIAGTQSRKTVKYWFRRVIDEQDDTVYQIVQVTGVPPQWVTDSSKSTTHGLGFCPVVWVRTLPISSDSVDGQPVVDPALYKLLDRVNYVYSLRSRSVEYTLDPQWVRKNVGVAKRDSLQKSPGKIWDIEDDSPDKKAEISLVEAKGSGSDTAGALLIDLRKRFVEACRVVIADPDDTAGRILSGVVLEYLHAPMIALASDLRKDLGDEAFCDTINLALRIVCAVKGRGEDVYVQGVDKAVRLMMTAQLGGPWLDFPVRLQWSRFFAPTAQDVGFAVQAAAQAKSESLVAQATATQFVSDYFGVANVDAEVDQVQQEKADAQKQALKQAQQLGAGAGGPPAGATPASAKTSQPISQKPPKPGGAGKA